MPLHSGRSGANFIAERLRPRCLARPSTIRTFSSSRPHPRFRIPAHVAAFTVLLTPAILYFAFYERFGDEEQLQEELREKYAEEIRVTTTKNQHMADFFRHTFRNPDGTADEKIDELLKAGKKAKKRLHAVDDSLYGTAQGVAEKQRTEHELAKQKRVTKEKKSTSNVESPSQQRRTTRSPDPLHASDKQTPQAEGSSRATVSGSMRMPSADVDAKTVISFAGVAALAAAVGYVFGGRSNRS